MNFTYSKLRTRKFTVVICLSIWIILFLLASPIYNYVDVIENFGTNVTSCNFNFHRFTDMKQLLRNEGYVPYGNEDEENESKSVQVQDSYNELNASETT